MSRYCSECEMAKDCCVCEQDIVNEPEEDTLLMEDIEEMITKATPGASRCLACYFFNCRCKKGLEAK